MLSFFSLRKIFFRELFFTRILKQQTKTEKKNLKKFFKKNETTTAFSYN
jgi:hypothetical protein